MALLSWLVGQFCGKSNDHFLLACIPPEWRADEADHACIRAVRSNRFDGVFWRWPLIGVRVGGPGVHPGFVEETALSAVLDTGASDTVLDRGWEFVALPEAPKRRRFFHPANTGEAGQPAYGHEVSLYLGRNTAILDHCDVLFVDDLRLSMLGGVGTLDHLDVLTWSCGREIDWRARRDAVTTDGAIQRDARETDRLIADYFARPSVPTTRVWFRLREPSRPQGTRGQTLTAAGRAPRHS